MISNHLSKVNTASPENSIWRDLDHVSFRRHMIAFQQASKEVPSDPEVHSRREWENPRVCTDDPSHTIPFDVEQRLADDLAFLAAAEAGGNSVSAVGLEQSIDPVGLVVRLAANEGITQDVYKTFESIFGLLRRCATKTLSRNSCSEEIFDKAVTLSKERLLGRLKSKHWKPPHSLGKLGPQTPLHQDLRKVSNTFFQKKLSARTNSSILLQKFRSLCTSYQRVEDIGEDSPQMAKILREIVRESFTVCTTDGKYTIEETILGNGLDPSTIGSNKCVRQVNKIGHYWGLCFYLAEASRKYNSLFQNMRLHVLEPFATVKSAISSGQGKRTVCRVHAEMQLVVFYGQDVDRTLLKPRILGVSKSACFLCNIFIVTQGQFFITKTHGRLYHQWVIPDLATYTSNQREEYRRILATIDEKFLRISEEQASTRRRKYPMGSWLTLPNPLQPSPLPSNMGTVISETASSTDQPPKIPQNKLSTPAEHHKGIPGISNLTSIPGQVPAVSSAPLSSTSPEPKSTHFSSSTSFEQSSSPSVHLNVPSPRMAIHDQESMYLSSTTITLHQLPMQRTITAISPFRLVIGKMSTQIEFEGAGEGRIGVQTIQELNPDFPGTLIDIGALLPNDSICVENASRNEQLVLRLRYHRQLVQLCLQWV